MITKSQGYAPGWDLDLAYGEVAEERVAHLLGLESSQVEVKHDRHLNSPNLFVETHQCVYGSWRPSGINTSTATAWAFVFGDTFTFVPTSVLRLACSTLPLEARIVEYDVPTRGLLLPRTSLQAVRRG